MSRITGFLMILSILTSLTGCEPTMFGEDYEMGVQLGVGEYDPESVIFTVEVSGFWDEASLQFKTSEMEDWSESINWERRFDGDFMAITIYGAPLSGSVEVLAGADTETSLGWFCSQERNGGPVYHPSGSTWFRAPYNADLAVHDEVYAGEIYGDEARCADRVVWIESGQPGN